MNITIPPQTGKSPEPQRRSNQAGFIMLESMVTLLIISFGLLALAYMQTWGHRFGQDAHARTQATLIAGELMDRIRVSTIAASDASATTFTIVPTGNLTCQSGTVSATNDRNCFYTQISNRMPTGAGAVTTSGNMYLITIAWLDRYAGRYDINSDGLSSAECTANNRLWYNDNNLNWYPTSSKPTSPSCLLVQNWSMTR